MRLVDVLAEKAAPYWEESTKKPFLYEMAHGTLSSERFRNYMIQDYLYLLDYVDILKTMKSMAKKPELVSFVDEILISAEEELGRVHLPAMHKLGITDEEIRSCSKARVIIDYVDYMKSQLSENGLSAGLIAMYQCCRSYAHIIDYLVDNYKDEIEVSKYKHWFDGYTVEEYADTDRAWTEMLDREFTDVSTEELERYCDIFAACAEFENKLWDYLYEMK